MSLVELLEQLRRQHVHLYLDKGKLKYRAPKGALNESLLTSLRQHKEEIRALLSEAVDSPQIERRPQSRYEPFPLTELQHAYWVGEQGVYRQATTPYFYFEYDLPEQPLEHFAVAFEALVRRHDAFRLQVLQDARQRVLPFQGAINADLVDLRDYDHQARKEWLAYPRANIQRLLPPLDSGQPYFIKVGRMNGRCRLFLGLRLHIIDGPSVRVIFHDFLNFLQQADTLNASSIEPLPLSFRDYVLAREALAQQRLEADKDYWLSRLDLLPGAPQLPLAKATSPTAQTTFRRLSGRFSAEQWQQLQSGAKRYGISANAVLCQLFADVLSQWSREQAFSLNMLASQRPFDDPDMPQLIGNCGSTIIVQCDNEAVNFASRCQQLHKQMLADFAHSSYSGVSVIQAIQSQRGSGDSPVMPVVFTSGIQTASEQKPAASDTILTKVFSQVHTPQVWLDHQVVMEQGHVCYYWDYVDDIFPDDLVQDMFDLYQLQIERLCQTQDWSSLLDAYHLPNHRGICSEQKGEQPRGHLLSGFLAQVESAPERTALIWNGRHWSYKQLLADATRLAAYLQLSGVKESDPVALQIEKGDQQVIGILATLLVGAFYIPIDRSQPVQRRNQILLQSACDWLLTSSVKDQETLPEQVCLLDVCQRRELDEFVSTPISPKSTAYVIFTSGSTGVPKGVEMNHAAVLNTLADVSGRFLLTAQDRVIALSAYNFDLSVFDIFATLGVGAAIVMPSESDVPDPGQWLSLCLQHKVTVWNSVPALMEMAWQTATLRERGKVFESLRVIMFSGDWIPLVQARQILEQLPNTRFYSLGGATEAAIWSNYFPVTDIDPNWRTIPYGYSLKNQKLWVLDEQLRPCLPWASGEIYIAGEGLANGYFRDDVRTTQSFIYHPETGERLYRTGDLGCYQPSGCIDILGRTDFQIKLNGYRVELGEIEAAMDECTVVRQACSMVIENNLVAFIVANDVVESIQKEFVLNKIRESLEKRLPHYMIPSRTHLVQSLPVTANGKWDRKQMHQLDRELRLELNNSEKDNIEFQSLMSDPLLKELSLLWQQVLGNTLTAENYLQPDSDFFSSGGNSLSAVRLTNLIAQRFERRFPLSVFYRHETLEKQVNWLKKYDENETNPEKVILQEGESAGPILVLFHPVGGSLLCYQSLYKSMPKQWRIIGFQSTEDSSEILSERIGHWQEQLLMECGHNTRILLAGWSMGGVLAYEMASQLKNNRIDSSVIVVTIDSWISTNSIERFDDENTLWNGFVHDVSLGKLPNNVNDVIDIATLSSSLLDDCSDDLINYRWAQYKKNAIALANHKLFVDSEIEHVSFISAYCHGFSGLSRLNTKQMEKSYYADHFEIINMPFIEKIKQEIIPLVY